MSNTSVTMTEMVASEDQRGGHYERSSTGKSERRAASRATKRANRRAARRTKQKAKAHREPTPSTHRLVGVHLLDDQAWQRRQERGFRAALVARRDRVAIANALGIRSQHVDKFALA